MALPRDRLPRARAMIVAPQSEAVEAGATILRAGGSAVDAVLACALTQGVVDPLMCGIGGLGVMQLFDPASGRHIVLDGLSTCPAAATETMWSDIFVGECSDGFGYQLRGYVNELGHGAVTTPGILKLFAAAHAGFGRLPWAELFDPAIDCAAQGWMMRPHVHGMFSQPAGYGRTAYLDKLALTEDGKRLYLRPDGSIKRPGDTVHNPDLATTLERLAREGAAAFYEGAIGAAIAADMARHGGLLSRADLLNYRLTETQPVDIPYRGWRVAVPPPPAGGVVIGEILRILEQFDLAALGHNSPAYIATVSEAMKIAGRDKDRFIGDPRFVDAPLDRLLSDAYAADCAASIRAGERVSLPRISDAKGTTTVSCVDATGMVVSLTHTLGTPSGVIVPGMGFMLNGAMNWYDPRPGRAGSIAPGKKRYSSMSPSIVFDGPTPILTLGAPGGAWITTAIAQVLLNLLDWGMDMQSAVMAPRFSATSDTIDISNRIPRATERALREMGYDVARSPITYAFAAVHGITMYDGVLKGGADPQRDGYAAGIA